MRTAEVPPLVGGLALGLALLPALLGLLRVVTVQVNENEAVLVTRRGKLVTTLQTPGLHFVPSKILPWVQRQHVSLRLDFLHFVGLQIEDLRGAQVAVDLWIELRVLDAPRAAFAAASSSGSFEDVALRTARAAFAREDAAALGSDPIAFGRRVERAMRAEAARWGIMIERVRVGLIPVPPRARMRAARAEREGARRWLN
jgi:regulator of protease activity HflC (stomatin/prohibitin superfamily)